MSVRMRQFEMLMRLCAPGRKVFATKVAERVGRPSAAVVVAEGSPGSVASAAFGGSAQPSVAGVMHQTATTNSVRENDVRYLMISTGRCLIS
jgi:hypothetical protein